MASACGKVILLGEHAVVYGVSAIAAGLERGAVATATAGAGDRLRLGDRESTDGDAAQAFAALLAVLQCHDVHVQAELHIPSGMGLGASAALGVAIARAVIEHANASDKPDPRAELVRDAALAWERVFHGNPSGVDTAAATYGGCFRFSRSAGVKPLKIKRALPLCVALSGHAASTKKMVEQVAAYRKRKPAVVEKTLAGIASLVDNAALCIEAGDHVGLGKLLDLNQVLLAGLFLSTPEIEAVCQLAREAGALGAKLTGSGGGGAVVALTDADAEQPVLRAWRDAGFECFTTLVSAS